MTSIEDLTPQSAPSDSDAVANILNMLKRRRYLIIAFVILCTGITALVTSHLKPLYRVELNLLIDPHNIQVNDVQTLATQTGFFDTGLVRNQMSLLWSEDLIREVVTSLDLADSPDFQPGVSRFFKPLSPDNVLDRPLIVIRDVFSHVFGSAQTIAVPETPDARVNAAITQYLGQISVLNDGHSYIITLRVATSDPTLAVKIANAHARAYLDHQVNSKTASVKDANSSVTAQLDDLAEKLKASEEALRSFRDSSALIGPDSSTIISQQISDLSGKLVGVRSQIIDKQARLHALQSLLNDPVGSDAGTSATSPAYDRLRAKEQDLLQQEAEIRATFGDSYPKLAEIKLQITTTESQLRAEAGRMVKSASAEIAAARSQEEQLLSAMQSARAGVQNQENAAPNLHFLEAAVEANKTVYTAFLTRVQQLTAQETLQQPDGRIVGDAILPTHPYFPNKPLLIAGGFFGSAGAAIALALLTGFIAGGFDSLAQVERACSAPGLGIVPLVRKRVRRFGVHNQITGLPRSHYSERVRMIRNSLVLAFNPFRRGQVVLLTSSLPMEGKTSCAVSLAMSVAAAGRRTLLIDADLRKPAVGRLLGADTNRPGFGELIEANATIEEVVQVHERSGLHYIPADHASVTAQDRFNFDLSPEFFESVRSRYDYIFVDSPPLIAVSDALWLARSADATIFLVRWQRTPRSAVRAAVQKLRDSGAAITGVLLTFVDIKKSGSLTPSDFDYYLREVSKYYVHR